VESARVPSSRLLDPRAHRAARRRGKYSPTLQRCALTDSRAQAHASLPHNSAGAGQAIEDAYVLGELLRLPECTRGTLPQFLRAYEAVRRPRASRQQVHSRESGEVRPRPHPSTRRHANGAAGAGLRVREPDGERLGPACGGRAAPLRMALDARPHAGRRSGAGAAQGARADLARKRHAWFSNASSGLLRTDIVHHDLEFI
jgi:hypothetical protein